MESMINLTIEYVKIVNVMLFYRQISDENMPLSFFHRLLFSGIL